MKKTYNLGWGESVAVRQSFLETWGRNITLTPDDLENLGYPEHDGDPAIIKLTRKIVKRQIGKDYKHILITNGATGGVTIALRAFREKGYTQCWLNDPPHFRLFPGMIEAAGLKKVYSSQGRIAEQGRNVYLVDSPSNPLGTFPRVRKGLIDTPIVWDATYFNNVYCPGRQHLKPEHDVLVGSYGKLTGLNGLRVGWIATDDGLLYERMRALVTSEYCGISVPSTKLILSLIDPNTDRFWDVFEGSANFWLNMNREMWTKLEKYFGNQPVVPVGMFYFSSIDEQCKKLLEKSGIIWSPGSHLGVTDDFGRFNLGQSSKLIKEAVNTILRNDKIKR